MFSKIKTNEQFHVVLFNYLIFVKFLFNNGNVLDIISL